MEIVGKVAATIQNVLGPEAEELGRATGVIQRRRKFTAVSLLRMLVLTLLRKPDAKATDFQSTAAQLGLDVTSTAVENRFTPQLVGFLRAVLERTVLRVLAASPQTVDLLNKFTSVRIGDSSTIALPDELADQFPGCGGILRAGLAAMKIHLLWDFLTGSILQLRITPGRASDATNPIAQEVAPAGSLSLFDLGYFCLDRFQNLTRAGAFWISRLQHGTSVFDAQGQPLALLQYLRQQTGSGPIDVSILLGVSHRLPCRLIALRVPQEVADRRRQKAYVKAQKHGRVPSREYLEWQDWTIFVTNCEPELLTWEAVVVLYRARWQIELMFKLWKSHNRLATHRAGAAAEEQLAVVYVKLIAVLVQHWILLTATWCECRRKPDEGRHDHRRLGYVADRRPGRPRPTHRDLEPHEGRPPLKPGHASKIAISIPASPNSYRILYFWTTCLKFGVWVTAFPARALRSGTTDDHPLLALRPSPRTSPESPLRAAPAPLPGTRGTARRSHPAVGCSDRRHARRIWPGPGPLTGDTATGTIARRGKWTFSGSDPTTDELLIAAVHATKAPTRLSLLDGQGQPARAERRPLAHRPRRPDRSATHRRDGLPRGGGPRRRERLHPDDRAN